MTITTKFSMRERVLIPELELSGRIVEISVEINGHSYRVQYFVNGEQKFAWLMDDDLEAIAE